MNPTVTEKLKAEASRLGFALSGVCPAVTPTGVHNLNLWIDSGYAGQMHYLPDRREAYAHPDSILDGVKSLLMLGRVYRTTEPSPTVADTGRVSRYSWGRDYHDRIHDDLRSLAGSLSEMVPDARVRGVVDTAPLLEREFAQRAGLGWIGKNSLLLNRQAGSWFFLAALLTDIELDYDPPEEADHCGSCTACLDACPTDAFVAPYVLDSRRCISYLTIELRDAIPDSLREGLGDWVFGCDVCQEVCPWNHRVPRSLGAMAVGAWNQLAKPTTPRASSSSDRATKPTSRPGPTRIRCRLSPCSTSTKPLFASGSAVHPSGGHDAADYCAMRRSTWEIGRLQKGKQRWPRALSMPSLWCGALRRGRWDGFIPPGQCSF